MPVCRYYLLTCALTSQWDTGWETFTFRGNFIYFLLYFITGANYYSTSIRTVKIHPPPPHIYMYVCLSLIRLIRSIPSSGYSLDYLVYVCLCGLIIHRPDSYVYSMCLSSDCITAQKPKCKDELLKVCVKFFY